MTRETGPTRARVQRRSAPLLAALRRQPRWLVPLAALALLVGGLSTRAPAGALPLLLLAAGLGWLCYLSWPVLDPVGRGLRAGCLALLVAAAVLRLGG